MMITIMSFVCALPKIFMELIYFIMDVVDEEFVFFLMDSVLTILKYAFIGIYWVIFATAYLVFNEALLVRRVVVSMI